MTTPVASAARAAAAGVITPRERGNEGARTARTPRPRTARAPGARTARTRGVPAATAAPAAAPRAPARRPAVPATRRTAAPPAGRSRTAGKAFPALKLPSGGGHGLLVAEFAASVLLIGITPVLMRRPKDGHLYVPDDFVRLSAVSLLFFVLALASQGPKSSRVAGLFGALITLGVLYNAGGSLQAIGAVFTNAKAAKGAEQSVAKGTATVDAPVFTPTDPSGDPLGLKPTAVQQSDAQTSPAPDLNWA